MKTDAQKEVDNLARIYQNVFGSDGGKKVLEDLERICGYKDSSVNEANPNSLQTFFAEGKRRVYLRILWHLNRRFDNE